MRTSFPAPGESRTFPLFFFLVILHSHSLLTTRYKFRIKAENAYGISDESQESDPFDVNQPIAGESESPSIIQSSKAMLSRGQRRFDV